MFPPFRKPVIPGWYHFPLPVPPRGGLLTGDFWIASERPWRQCHEGQMFRLRRSRSSEPVPHVESTHGLRRRFKGRDFSATPGEPLRNTSLPHCSRVSQRQFCIIFFSKRRTVLIPSIKPSSSASFFRESVCQRSEARVTLRKPKNSRRIASSVNPSFLAH